MESKIMDSLFSTNCIANKQWTMPTWLTQVTELLFSDYYLRCYFCQDMAEVFRMKISTINNIIIMIFEIRIKKNNKMILLSQGICFVTGFVFICIYSLALQNLPVFLQEYRNTLILIYWLAIKYNVNFTISFHAAPWVRMEPLQTLFVVYDVHYGSGTRRLLDVIKGDLKGSTNHIHATSSVHFHSSTCYIRFHFSI